MIPTGLALPPPRSDGCSEAPHHLQGYTWIPAADRRPRVVPGGCPTPEERDVLSRVLDVSAGMRSGSVSCVCSSSPSSCPSWARPVVFPLRLLYAQAHHATPAQIGMMASAFLLAPLVAQIPLGWGIDRWGRVPVLLVGLVSHALISLCYIFFNTPVELILLRLLEGCPRRASNRRSAPISPMSRRRSTAPRRTAP